MNKLKYLPILFTIAIAVSSAPFAQAISYDIMEDHSSGGLGTAPFGTVTLTQNAGNVDFNVTLTAGYKFILSGAGDTEYFKFNGIGVAVGDITNINQNFPGFTLSGDSGNFNGDGTGNFAFGITSNHGNGGSPPQFAGPISFSVLNATIADFTNPNNNNFLFAVDLLAPNGNTGPAGVMPTDMINPLGTVPDGGMTLMLLGAALGSLGMARRFLKS